MSKQTCIYAVICDIDCNLCDHDILAEAETVYNKHIAKEQPSHVDAVVAGTMVKK